ncbi:hypothetical protein ACWCQ0_54195 [Streptomyces massasporeus]
MRPRVRDDELHGHGEVERIVPGAEAGGARYSGATAVRTTVYGAPFAGSAVNSHDGTSSRSPSTSRAARPNTAAVTGTWSGAARSTIVWQGGVGSTCPGAGVPPVRASSGLPFPSTPGGAVGQRPTPIGPVPFASSFSPASAFAAPITGYTAPSAGSFSVPLPATARPSRAMCSPVDQPYVGSPPTTGSALTTRTEPFTTPVAVTLASS